jgi:2-dehydro-3-deoxyphosphooctonate aldolase (KDO 8-P synthase)
MRFKLIAGPCAIEDRELAFSIAREVKAICDRLDIEYIFKGSFKKANRSRLDSFTGIGDTEALEILRDIGQELGIETITDIHESPDAALAAKYVDHLQIPAFLCRQTDLLIAAGETGKGVNMKWPVQKIQSTGNDKAWVCERGVSFGYSDLIVDATAIARLKTLGVPVIMDCTHSVQKPNRTEGVTGGDPQLIETIALSAIATGADGFFIETHPAPHTAQSDPYTMLELSKLEGILEKAMRIRKALA